MQRGGNGGDGSGVVAVEFVDGGSEPARFCCKRVICGVWSGPEARGTAFSGAEEFEDDEETAGNPEAVDRVCSGESAEVCGSLRWFGDEDGFDGDEFRSDREDVDRAEVERCEVVEV